MKNYFCQTASVAFLLITISFSISNAVDLNCDLTNGADCNPGCKNNSKCSTYLADILPSLALLMSSQNFQFNHTPGASPIESYTVFFPSNFNLTLSKNVCSVHIPDNKSRTDSSQVTWDFYTFSLYLDLQKLIPAVINGEWILTDLFGIIGECGNPVNAVTNLQISDTILTDITKCTPNLLGDISLLTNDPFKLVTPAAELNLKGTFNATLSNVAINVLYSDKENANMTSLFVGYDNENNIKLTNKICTGSASFKTVCDCVFESDEFVRTLLTLRGSALTCVLQTLFDDKVSNILKCDDY